MKMRKAALAGNSILLVATFCSLFWSVQASWYAVGIVTGLVIAAPSIVALLLPGRIHDSVVEKINLWIMLVVATITLLQLQNELADATGEPVVDIIITLFLTLGLCASMQLLVSTADKREPDSADAQLHVAYGGPSVLFMLTVSMVFAGMLQSLVSALADSSALFFVLNAKLVERGVIPYFCLILFFWGILILVANYYLVRAEYKQLSKDIQVKLHNPLSATGRSLLLLFGEARSGNSRSKKVACVGQLSDLIWEKTEYLYTLPRYINWAIPILGFIGTVLGISLAAESIGGLISSPETNFSSALGEAIAPLGIAFDTTLVALSLSVFLMLLQTLSQRWQEKGMQAIEQKIRDVL